MGLIQPWIVGYLQDEAPDLDYKVAELPYSKAPATFAFTVAYVMGQNSAHKEEAFKLIEFLTGPEAQHITVEGGLALPSHMSLAEDFIEKYPERKAWVLGGDYARPYTLGPNFGRKNQIFDNAVEAVFLGQKTAEEALTGERMGEFLTGYVMLMPAVLLLAIFFFYPILFVFSLAFQDYNLLRNEGIWIGLDHFRRLLDDGVFHRSLYNTFFYVIGVVPVQTAMAVLLALIVNANIRGKTFSERLILFPPSPLRLWRR